MAGPKSLVSTYEKDAGLFARAVAVVPHIPVKIHSSSHTCTTPVSRYNERQSHTCTTPVSRYNECQKSCRTSAHYYRRGRSCYDTKCCQTRCPGNCSLGATFMGLFGHLTRRIFTPIYHSPLSRWVSLLERGTRVMSTDKRGASFTSKMSVNYHSYASYMRHSHSVKTCSPLGPRLSRCHLAWALAALLRPYRPYLLVPCAPVTTLVFGLDPNQREPLFKLNKGIVVYICCPDCVLTLDDRMPSARVP